MTGTDKQFCYWDAVYGSITNPASLRVLIRLSISEEESDTNKADMHCSVKKDTPA
jgi:hypothetical protein